MNLGELFEMQRKLDEHIVREKGLDGQDLLPKKILALQVELGELANEWRGFKFWSNNQESRTKIYTSCKDDIADIWQCGNGSRCGVKFSQQTEVCPKCGWDTVISYKTRNPLLEEYVDCLHFILSIGLDIEKENIEVTFPTYGIKEHEFITERFLDVVEISTNMRYDDYYRDLLTCFLELGYMLGFTWEQVVQAYKDKNQVNHARQENGY